MSTEEQYESVIAQGVARASSASLVGETDMRSRVKEIRALAEEGVGP